MAVQHAPFAFPARDNQRDALGGGRALLAGVLASLPLWLVLALAAQRLLSWMN